MSLRALCVSMHDVAPATWPACRTLLAAVAQVDDAVPVTLLAVPDYHSTGAGVSPDYRAWLAMRVARGDEIALHGYTHRDDEAAASNVASLLERRVYTAAEGEFAAVSRDTAARKIAAGRAWCETLGVRPRGFVAPAWLMSRGTWEALPAFDFSYTTTLRHFHLLHARRAVPSWSLVYSARSGWRRWMSRRWNALLERALRDAPLVRLGLHPADAAHPELVAHIQCVLDRARRGRASLTKEEYAGFAARGN